MKYKALKSFSGSITMTCNEIRTIDSQELIDDLLQAKYIEEIVEVDEVPKIQPKSTKKK